MRMKNTSAQFGLVSIVNHWVTAILVIGVIALGIYMGDLPKGPERGELYDLHKSLGVIILGLFLLRVVWLKLSPNPESLPSTRFEHILAHSVKGVLYLALVLMPLSGWIMSNSGGDDVAVFDWFVLPAIVPENEWLHEATEEFHEIFGELILPAIILLHIAGALKHHYIKKDATLNRMLGKK
ncbi:cytochrome b [Hydrogenovibrio sp. 3SP14C1]|uniref:cytochrome b n=1 Tax=Hydrogenovibrio sp. 3SP14C1 TaxID=3038774 RepID=UPI002415BB8F|nr:cytochrome b [Hydrogenovibrio sp. 3SP14C1]MDG4812424.1 cytochrome b [Hydrogenovibrio sp. 3SP14C1]